MRPLPDDSPDEAPRRERPSAAFPPFLAAPALALALGCGSAAPPPDKNTPSPPPPQPLQLVEADAPFVVDWDARQAASLADVVRSPNKGAVVVAYERNVIRILPDCHLTGVYVPSGIGMYRGMLQVRRSDARNLTAGLRKDALQQIATSPNIPGDKLIDYRFVVVGRHHLGTTRTSAKVTDLSGRSASSCKGATHFIRAALTGAFERVLTPEATLEAQTLPAAGASPLPVRAGDFTQCLVAATAGSPACSAFLKIELTEIEPADAPTGTVPAPTGTLPAPAGTSPTPPITAPSPSTTVRPAATSVQPATAPVATIPVPVAPTSTMPVVIPVPKPPPPPPAAPSTAPSVAPSTAPSAPPAPTGTSQ